MGWGGGGEEKLFIFNSRHVYKHIQHLGLLPIGNGTCWRFVFIGSLRMLQEQVIPCESTSKGRFGCSGV